MRKASMAILAVVVLCTGTVTATPNPFPAAYTTAAEYGGHWYAMTLDYGTWQESEDEAVSLGWDLVTISDPNENAWVAGFIADSFIRIGDGGGVPSGWNIAWIGYRFEAEWGWESDEPVTYSNHKEGASPWEVYSGAHAYIHGANHPEPEWWNHNSLHESFDFNPRGVIEIPEPVTLSLLTLGGLGLIRRRRLGIDR